MKLDIDDAGDVKVFRFEGKLETNATPEAGPQLGDAIDHGATKNLIGFEELDFVRVAGVRVACRAGVDNQWDEAS